MTEEEYLHEQLALLHREYLKAAQPYIDRLVAIASMRGPKVAYLTINELNAWAESKARAAIAKAEEQT